VRLTHRRAMLRLAEPFTISRETTVEEEVLWIEVDHDERVICGMTDGIILDAVAPG